MWEKKNEARFFLKELLRNNGLALRLLLWSASWQETSKHRRLEKEGVFSLAYHLVSCFAFQNLHRLFFLNAFRKNGFLKIFSRRQDLCW